MGNEDKGGTRTKGNESEGERERGGTYWVGTGLELSRVNRSCVRTGSDSRHILKMSTTLISINPVGTLCQNLCSDTVSAYSVSGLNSLMTYWSSEDVGLRGMYLKEYKGGVGELG